MTHTLAYDHALIGWAMIHADPESVYISKKQTDGKTVWWSCAIFNGSSADDCWDNFAIADFDPFGFPILTDPLRARLIAAKKAAS